MAANVAGPERVDDAKSAEFESSRPSRLHLFTLIVAAYGFKFCRDGLRRPSRI
jgi:hypothetical protein